MRNFNVVMARMAHTELLRGQILITDEIIAELEALAPQS
jgi:hypothetical protein